MHTSRILDLGLHLLCVESRVSGFCFYYVCGLPCQSPFFPVHPRQVRDRCTGYVYLGDCHLVGNYKNTFWDGNSFSWGSSFPLVLHSFTHSSTHLNTCLRNIYCVPSGMLGSGSTELSTGGTGSLAKMTSMKGDKSPGCGSGEPHV